MKILRRIRSSIDTSVQKKKKKGGGGVRSQKSFFRPFGPHFGLKIRGGGGSGPPRAPPLDTLSAQRIYQSMVMPIFTHCVSVIVLDGQSPANTWSASLRNEALENIPPKCSPHYSDHRFLTTDNCLQKKACCFDLTAVMALHVFKNYFRRLHHDAFNLQTIGKQQNCPRSNWIFCVSLFLFFRCLDSQFNAIKFNKT